MSAEGAFQLHLWHAHCVIRVFVCGRISCQCCVPDLAALLPWPAKRLWVICVPVQPTQPANTRITARVLYLELGSPDFWRYFGMTQRIIMDIGITPSHHLSPSKPRLGPKACVYDLWNWPPRGTLLLSALALSAAVTHTIAHLKINAISSSPDIVQRALRCTDFPLINGHRNPWLIVYRQCWNVLRICGLGLNKLNDAGSILSGAGLNTVVHRILSP